MKPKDVDKTNENKVWVTLYGHVCMYVCMYIFKFTSQPKAELRKLQ